MLQSNILCYFRYDVPDEYMPPEAYGIDGRKRPLKGKTFDLWCLGIISSQVFTANYLSRNMPNHVCCWSDFVYPVLFKTLKVSAVKKYVYLNNYIPISDRKVLLANC